LLAVTCALASARPSSAQEKKELGQAIITLYRIAPGKHLEFLKWMAAREEVSKEAGLSTDQWYVHTNGDGWDYFHIAPVTTPEQDKKVDEISKKKGLTVGFPASLELRHYIEQHSDTFVVGPTSASDLVARANR
jgi:hypothetical protein